MLSARCSAGVRQPSAYCGRWWLYSARQGFKARRSSARPSQSRVHSNAYLRVRMKRSVTALPVGRPTGAKVCSKCQSRHSVSQSLPVYCDP